MIEHRHVIFVLAVVKVAKRDVTAVRSLLYTIPQDYPLFGVYVLPQIKFRVGLTNLENCL